MLSLVLAVITLALVFDFVNGFHDTANCIATVVATKTLSSNWALVLAVVTNLLGALAGTAVALTIASGILNSAVIEVTPKIILCALIAGIIWNVITWLKGLPSSSSHSLIGGLCGVGLAAAKGNWDVLVWSHDVGSWVKNGGILWKVIVPMITSPLAGFIISIVMMVVLWGIIATMEQLGGVFRRLVRPAWINTFFSKVQILSAAYMGFAHGHNDAQKTMGIIAMTIVAAETAGALQTLPPWLSFLHPVADRQHLIAPWIVILCGTVMAAGTALGGWRVIKTLGYKMVRLHPIHGFTVETSAASILMIAAEYGMPVSTTHSISTAIIGVGFAKNPRALRYNLIERIVWSWVLTIPASAVVAWVTYQLLHFFSWI